MTQDEKTLGERVSSLETSVAGLHSELSDVRRTLNDGFRDLHNSMASGNKTNWGVVLTSILVVMALYAAAIRPIIGDVGRLEDNGLTLATAVLDQNKFVQENRNSIMVLNAQVEALRQSFEDVKTQGAPAIDRRLSILEYKLGVIK